jgi:tyrosinase
MVPEYIRKLLRTLRRRPDVTASIATEPDTIRGTDVAEFSGTASPSRPDGLPTVGSDRADTVASVATPPAMPPESAAAGDRTDTDAKSAPRQAPAREDDSRQATTAAQAGPDASAGGHGSPTSREPKRTEDPGTAAAEDATPAPVAVPLWQRLSSRRKILVGAVAMVAVFAAAVGYRGFERRRPVIRPNSSPERNAKPQLRVRPSITDLQNQYTAGNKRPLEQLWRAWIGIERLPANDPRSFFTLAGYHGEPFRGPGATDEHYWGGYCQHGDVLFPTWHRVYLLKLEEALRSVPGCQDVTLPYWDETGADSLANGIPWALTRQTVELDGHTIPNPLRSFAFNADIVDNVKSDNLDYSKPKGYETVRYPLSGLVGTPDDSAATTAHNAQFPDYDHNVALLNQNITTWLAGTELINGKPDREGQVADNYQKCLDAPNYTVFSNKTSADQWNKDNSPQGPLVQSLEAPHAGIHLAVGGFDVPNHPDRSPIAGANGDMGENETAAFDPIFFFHHCFVDRVFWLWQQRHGATDKLDIIAGYAGTDSHTQGATPGMEPETPLTLDTPLYPFTKADGTPYTSMDCINIEKLGITYGPGSLQGPPAPRTPTGQDSRVIAVSGINPATIHGSFLVSAFGTTGGERVHLGTEAVLSHWNVSDCANCHTHPEVKAFFGVPPAATGLMRAATEDMLADTSSYAVEVRTRYGVIQPREPTTALAPQTRAAEINGQPDFRFEIK